KVGSPHDSSQCTPPSTPSKQDRGRPLRALMRDGESPSKPSPLDALGGAWVALSWGPLACGSDSSDAQEEEPLGYLEDCVDDEQRRIGHGVNGLRSWAAAVSTDCLENGS